MNSGRGPRRGQWARSEIERLDAVADHERIAHLSNEVRYGEPVLTAALYTVAFSRQMAVPSIATVVHRGGDSPIMRATRRRNDDTMTFFGEFLRHGHSSSRGRAYIHRLNDIHARFPITNDQSLYTLASLTFEADRIPSRLGVELLSHKEKRANFRFWRGVGEQMALRDLPETYDGFWRWTLDYERRNFGFSAGGRAVVDAMLQDYAARFLPRAWLPIGRGLLVGTMDAHLRATHRLSPPRRGLERCLAASLRAYSLTRRLLPDPPERSWTDTYGHDADRRPEALGARS